MIRLELLGGLDLRDAEGRELHSVLAQPKRTALLSCLALGEPGFHRRDQLIALFWPESDADRARKALRQATFFLRRSLGQDAILSRGDDELGLNAERVACDVREFEERIERDDLAGAIELYRGELLPGFHVAGVPEFDYFIDSHRARLHRQALEAGARHTDSLIEHGRLDDALQCARWCVELAPADAAPVSRILHLLEQAGDRTGALRAYDEYAARLAREYELEPDPALQSMVLRLRAAGQRVSPNRASGPSAPTGGSQDTPRSGVTSLPDREPDVSSAMAGQTVPRISSVADVSRAQKVPPSRRGPTALLRLVWLAGALAIVALLGRILGVPAGPEGGDTIAMFPLRVVTADTSQQILGEGIAHIAALAFTGEPGPRPLDMRRTIRALNQVGSTREAANRLGATYYIDGSAVETAGHLTVSFSLHETATNRVFDTWSREGPVESVVTFAHWLATTIVARVTGQEQQLVNYLGDAPIQATRHYFEGTAAYREGDYYRAEREFHEAILLDSTVAPFKFGLLLASGWTGSSSYGPDARRLAWESRDELPAPERGYVEALLGGPPGVRFSGVTDPGQAVKRWVDYMRIWPDNEDGWYGLGDRFLHGGPMTGYADYLDRAEGAFRRALELNPSLAQAHLHLVDVLVHRGVVPGVPGVLPGPLRSELRSLADTYFQKLAPGAEFRTAEAWRTAKALEDETWLRQVEARVDSMPLPELHQIVRSALAYGWALEDAERAVSILERRAFSDDTWQKAIGERASLEFNAGRPTRANDAAAEMQIRQPDRPLHLFMRVEAALLGDGDEAAAAAAAIDLERVAAEPAALDPVRRHDQYLAGFFAATWKLMRGEPDPDDVTSTIGWIREGLVEDSAAAELWGPMGEFYTAFLDALLAATGNRPDALRKAIVADSVLQRRWGESSSFWEPAWVVEGSGPVLIMRLHEMRGDHERALAAARRHGVGHTSAGSGAVFLSTRLLVEARLAARAGDFEGARRAYTHYLALRTDPEPTLRGLRDSVRAELDGLPGR